MVLQCVGFDKLHSTSIGPKMTASGMFLFSFIGGKKVLRIRVLIGLHLSGVKLVRCKGYDSLGVRSCHSTCLASFSVKKAKDTLPHNDDMLSQTALC